MIPVSFPTAADGIAGEAALLHARGPAILLWQAERNALVMPRSLARRNGIGQVMTEAAEAGWPVTSRGSGGGIVPQGPGTLNLAIVMPTPPGFTLEAGYRLICGAVAEALSRFDIASATGARAGAFCDGDWNVLVQGRKIAGTAQRWRASSHGRVVLAHAAILVAPPAPDLWPVLGRVHEVAFPAGRKPVAEAHIALSDVAPSVLISGRFPAALVRAAEAAMAALLYCGDGAA